MWILALALVPCSEMRAAQPVEAGAGAGEVVAEVVAEGRKSA